MISKHSAASVHNIIVGVESLDKMGTILNFAEATIFIGHVTLTMRPHNNFINLKALHSQYQGNLEPSLMQQATKHAEEILDAKYEKVDNMK